MELGCKGEHAPRSARGNIHMVLDCDVVLGGYLAGCLERWFPLL